MFNGFVLQKIRGKRNLHLKHMEELLDKVNKYSMYIHTIRNGFCYTYYKYTERSETGLVC